MKYLDLVASQAHWLLRIGLASVFFFHGTLKFLDLEGFAEMLPISYTEVVLIALAQVGGSLLLIVGGFRDDFWSDLATRIGALLNIPTMIGAIVLVHWGRWNFVPTEAHPLGGMEFQVFLGLIMLYLMVVGNRAIRPVATPRVAASLTVTSSEPEFAV